MNIRIWNWVLIGLALFMTSSCATRMSNDVVSFHEGDLPNGETIAIEPLDPKKVGSLEFKHYAVIIKENLQKIGYVPTDDIQSASLVAKVDYRVSEGRTETKTEPGGYAYYHFNYGRYYDPFYFGFRNRWVSDNLTYTVYDRTLKVNIVKASNSDVVFEGRVRSSGKENELAEIMPYMITAMFANFPGESGVTKVVTIEKNQ